MPRKTETARPMSWYLAPRYYHDGYIATENPNEVRFDPLAVDERPGVLVDGSVRPWPGAGVAFKVPVYDRTGNVCLVGVSYYLTVVPEGWTHLTLEAARECFMAVKGRAPSEREVY